MHRLYPLLFVFLWSTGFVGAKFGLPHAEPLSFLLTRYVLVIGLMGGVALLSRAPWPASPRQWLHIAVSGVMVHAIYLGGVFVAISHGLSAGITALVVGLQPLLTGLAAAPLLGERVSLRQWLGLACGFFGVALVVAGKADAAAPLGPMLWPALIALLGITAGTLYQKRFCPQFDLRTGSVVQFLAAGLVTAVAVAAGDGYRVAWTGDFLFALGWLVLVLSIRSGSAVNVASLFYLTPPTTALIAWLVFGEQLSLLSAAGMAVAVAGVYLVAKKA